MPCDTIILNRVDLNLADRGILRAALGKMPGVTNVVAFGETISFDRHGLGYSIRAGKLVGPGEVGALADEIKQAYSREIVAQTAKKYGWQVKQKSPNKFEVIKR
jgi:hypothetical protein